MSVVDNRATAETHKPKPMIPLVEVGASLVINETMIPRASSIETFALHYLRLHHLKNNLMDFMMKEFGGMAIDAEFKKIREKSK